MSFRLLSLIICLLISVFGNKLIAQEQQLEVLPSEINSPHIEIRPFITGDGNTLYFGRREHPENTNGVKDLQDIWKVSRNGETWGSPENLGDPVNNKLVNSLCTVSPDGQELLVLNTYKKLEGPLARIRKAGDRWGEPKEVVIESYYNHSEYLDFYQSYAHNVLFMALERDDTFGEQDLYVSFLKDDGSWTKPLNLGKNINTKKSDFAPFLASDGKTLFFSSYGIKGKGGADIFFSTRLDDSWTKWSKPVNLGAPINTAGEETYCSLTDDRQSLFFVSYKLGTDKRDIFKTMLPPSLEDYQPAKPQAAVAAGRKIKGLKAENTDSKDVRPAANTLVRSSEATEAAKVDRTGTARVSAEARTGNAAQKPSPMLNAKSLTIDLKHRIVGIDEQQQILYSILQNVYFDFNRTQLKKGASGPVLEKILAYMQENAAAKLIIVGHADELGNARANSKVSQQRAETVKRFLVNGGIAAERIKVAFKADKQPMASNDDNRNGRELNRRVELFVLLPADGS